MNSPRRKQGSAIQSVGLKITFRVDRQTAAKIVEKVPSAVVKGGLCVVRIEGDGPGEVEEKAKAILELVRSAGSASKGFK
ncbi:MAG: hypothetical protein JRN44_01335 [Nitrososphaerota archaeon]|jgi:hypothetical protein|nr:hypothetical protein [Nitrososphaerota archaeon]MDG6941678.1 hypothetical protein [Nitrososphaerota archaeon]MDG6947148.1 hypothetical protein [Nitrososphaerota archaeon]MDG6951274.1 hypothetical protein [Nitrososphaerota archaeon]